MRLLAERAFESLRQTAFVPSHKWVDEPQSCGAEAEIANAVVSEAAGALRQARISYAGTAS